MFKDYDNQLMDIMGKDRRTGQRDWRPLTTYIADERRSGIADIEALGGRANAIIKIEKQYFKGI